MSTRINAPETRNPRKNPRKIRKPVTLQALRSKRKPTAWLRSLISPLDFGVKITRVDPAGEPGSRPIHCNTNAEILDAFRHGDWHRIDRLSNPMLDDHWDDRRTYYYTCNGSTRHRLVLVNIDIDCHATGSPEAAAEAAEYLKANFFPDIYHEPSTNGQGRHGYFILDKWDLGAEAVKGRLKALERVLNDHLLAEGFDIELCEIKGQPPVVSWGNDGRISNYTAGILANIPRQVERFEEWKRTTALDPFRLGKLVTRLRSLTPEVSPAEKLTVQVESGPSKPKRVSGSIGGKLIDDEELAQLAEDGRYRGIAIALMEALVLKTSGRSVVIAEDVAIFLLCLKFFTNRMNSDGTMPVKRFEELWSALYGVGDVGRSFDCHRFKAIRDYLSDLGLIDWEDETYVAPRIDESGTRQKGRACKWKAGRVLMGMLEWEKREVEGAVAEELGRDEAVGAGLVHEGGGEEAPLVGTVTEVASRGVHEGGRGGAPLVGTARSSPLPLPDPVVETIRSLSFVADDLRFKPVEVVGEKAWHLFPDEVTVLVPCFEESIGLLAA